MRVKRKKSHDLRKWIVTLFTVVFIAALVCGVYFGYRGYEIYREAVSEKTLEEQVEEIQDMEHFVSYETMSEFYKEALVSVEDKRFYRHCGIDLLAIGRAILADIKAGAFVQGGSTITQQVVKNLLFDQEKKIERKAAEVFAAFALEEICTKEEILELYANTAYFGNGYYGIYEAAQGYFGKDPADISDYEAAMLAGIPNAPSAYSPDKDLQLADERTGKVIESMERNGLISGAEAEVLMEQR